MIEDIQQLTRTLYFVAVNSPTLPLFGKFGKSLFRVVLYRNGWPYAEWSQVFQTQSADEGTVHREAERWAEKYETVVVENYEQGAKLSVRDMARIIAKSREK